MKEVKIVRFYTSELSDGHDYGTPETERKVNTLVNEGWKIVTSGGNGNYGCFIVLEREQ